jgi:hypothetical protein
MTFGLTGAIGPQLVTESAAINPFWRCPSRPDKDAIVEEPAGVRVVLVFAVQDIPLERVQADRLSQRVALTVNQVLLDPAPDEAAECRR